MNISEKIDLLKSELESLNKELEKSRSSFETSKNFVAIMNSTNISENYEAWEKMVREYLANELEFLRTQVAMIRKISPQTADYLSDDIKKYEDSSRSLLVDAKVLRDKKLPSEQILEKMALNFLGFVTSYTKLHDMTKICRDCIHDTLKRLE